VHRHQEPRDHREALEPGVSTGGAKRSSTIPLPAVVSVKEGINLPRYPSLPGAAAKRAAIDTLRRSGTAKGSQGRLRVPAQEQHQAQVLGSGRRRTCAMRLLEELEFCRARMPP